MIEQVGFVVLGQASVDDIAPEISKHLPNQVQVLTRGALDGLTKQAITDIQPCEGDYLLVCRVEPGEEAQVAFDKVFPFVQDAVYALESEGAELIAVLCGANWTELKSNKLLINPGSILPQLVVAISRSKKLGMVLPTILQVESSQQKYRHMGATDAVATYITLYDGGNASKETSRAADFLVSQNVDLIWLPCMGMGRELQTAFQKQVKRPVLLAQAMLGKVLNELIGQTESLPVSV